MRILPLLLLLTACTAAPAVPQEACTIDTAFTCGELFADGAGKYYFKLTNTAGISISDLSVQVNSDECAVTQQELSATTLPSGGSVTVPFSCSQTEGFSGSLFIQYRIISPYGGEPLRIARGTINYENA